jgi:glyoxylase-like metal-dependent hydrolase (beta-lactamase superfamily II)
MQSDSGQAQDLPGGVHRIELPLPFELEAINVYLVELARGYLLIDCGLDDPESFTALEAGLANAGCKWPDIRLVLLTHMHPDHIGLCRRVREMSGATLLMHAIEAEHLDSLVDEGRRLPYLHSAYNAGGVPKEQQQKMDAAFGFLRKGLHDIRPDRLLRGSEEIDSALGPLEVVCTPGHSPGHVCLYSRDVRLLFSGDHILDGITPNISWRPGYDMLGEYIASLQKVAQLDIDLVLPAHGNPFRGHRQWVTETIAHHERRCDEIVEALGTGAQTAHDIVGRLWTRQLDPIHQHFAVFEVLAHLEHMQRADRVQGHARNGGTEWHALRA